MSQIVNAAQRVEAKRKVRRWAETGQAVQAVLCAAKMLLKSIQVRLIFHDVRALRVQEIKTWHATATHCWTIYYAFVCHGLARVHD